MRCFTLGFAGWGHFTTTNKMFGASFRARTWLSAVAAAALACALFLGAISPVAAQDPDPPLPPSADLTVTKTGPATASANSNVTYTIDILNIGPEDALNALLSDPLPGGMTFVSLSTPSSWTCTTPAVGSGGTVTCTNPNFTSGSSASFSLTLNIPAGTPGGTFFTNIATVSSAVFDVNDENNSSTAVTLVAGAVSADMFVTKTGPATITAGQNIVYSIQAGN